MKIRCSKFKHINDLSKNENVKVKKGELYVAGCIKCGTILKIENEVK